MLRFAILQTAFIGDVALSLPLPQAIRNNVHSARITFVTTPAAASLVSCATSVDEALIFDKRGEHSGLNGLSQFAAELRKRNFDYILSPHRSVRSALLARLSQSETSVGFSVASWAFLYDKCVEYRTSDHETKRVLSLLEAVEEIKHPLNAPEVVIEISASDIEHSEILWRQTGIDDTEKVVAVAPGSVWATKRWPKQYFAQVVRLIRQRGCRTIIIGSKEDASLCEETASQTGSISIAGKTTLPQTLHILRRCSVALTNDSAPAHLARLINTPSVTIFGPTMPQFGFASSGEYDRVIENTSLACRPCTIHGGKKCPIGTFECMTSLKPEMVADAVFQILETISLNCKK